MDEAYDPLSAVKTHQIVRQQYPNATLTMAGDGHLTRSLVDYIAERGIEGVSLTGRLTAEGVAGLLAESSICLNTSRVDGLPTALLEAAATGLPIVTTSVGGIVSLFEDGVSALFVEPGDCEAMANAICGLIEDPDRARAMGAAARAVAIEYSWPVARADYVRFYGVSNSVLHE
jgi:glycosyltransferase involved in cell wall biosynthesis